MCQCSVNGGETFSKTSVSNAKWVTKFPYRFRLVEKDVKKISKEKGDGIDHTAEVAKQTCGDSYWIEKVSEIIKKVPD